MKRSVIINSNMGTGVQKSFKAVVNEHSESLSILVESVSEVSYSIPEPIKFV